MKRLSLAGLVLCFLCAGAFAQQGNTNIKLPSLGEKPNSSHDFQPGQLLLRSPKVLPDLSFLSRSLTIPRVQVRETQQPQFKFINGAVYISLSADRAMYMPISGGGASGCLTFDLPVETPTSSPRHRLLLDH